MQVHGGDEASERHAHDCAARGKRDVTVVPRAFARGKRNSLCADICFARQLHHEPRKAEADHKPRHRLKNLADGRGGHVALTLEEAAIGGDKADEQHARSERCNCRPRVFVCRDHHGKGLAENQHAEASNHADGQKHVERRFIGSSNLRVVPKRLRLRDHAAHSHGKTRRRDHEQDVIDVVGGIEVAEAALLQDVLQRDLVDEAEQLHDDRRGGQDGDALQKALLLGFVLAHACSASALSEKILSMA